MWPDFGARRDLAEALAAGVVDHVADVRRRLPGADILVQVDEPALPAVMAGQVPTASGFHRHRSVDPPKISAGLEPVMAAITAAGATPVVHCCAAAVPVALLRGAGARGLLVDLEVLAAECYEPLAEALEAGDWIGLGIAGESQTQSALNARAHRFFDMLGLAPTEQTMLTSSCGLASSTPDAARALLSQLTVAAKSLSPPPLCAICAHNQLPCIRSQGNIQQVLYVLTGSSCSGKSTLAFAMADRFDSLVVHDFDEVGVPEGADRAWRHRTLIHWIDVALAEQAQGRDLLLTGQSPLGEVLAVPRATELEGIAVCLLDVADDVRRDRLVARDGGFWSEQDIENFIGWANWHRRHAAHPQHAPQVIVDPDGPMQWQRWLSWTAAHPDWNTHVIDTTGFDQQTSADQLAAWMESVHP